MKQKKVRFAILGLAVFSLPSLAKATKRPTPLSLQDAVELALTQNPDRKVRLLEKKEAKASHRAQQAQFDASVFSSFRYERGASSTQGTQNMLANGFSRRNFELGGQKKFPFGGSISLSLGIVRSRNLIALPTATGRSEVEVQEYFVQPKITFRQPLLQNAGRAVTLAPIKKARALVDAAHAEWDRRTIAIVRDVLLAYWDLKAAQLSLDACNKAKSLVLQQIETTKILIKEGRRAPRDRLALKQELSVKQIDLQAAQTLLHHRGTDLQLLMGIPIQSKKSRDWRALASPTRTTHSGFR